MRAFPLRGKGTESGLYPQAMEFLILKVGKLRPIPVVRGGITKEDVTMKQIIKFIDSNVDGCGTNVEMLIQIEGKNPLSTELVDALKHAIHEYIDSNAGEWSTDDVVNQACEYLESQGYICLLYTSDAADDTASV